MVASRILAVLPALTVAQDVKIDWDKLTDFSTDYAYTLQMHDVTDGIVVKDLNVKALIQLDLANERLKYAGTSTFDIIHNWRDPSSQIAQGQSAGGFYFDPKHGLVVWDSTTVHSMLGTQEFAGCVKSDVPPGKVPPAAALQQMLEPKEAMIEQLANAAPHTVSITDGTVTYDNSAHAYPPQYHLPFNKMSLTVEPDGTPVSASRELICDAQCQEDYRVPEDKDHLVVNFTNWKKGAGEMEAPHCVEASLPAGVPSISLITMDALADWLVQSEHTHDIGKHLARLTVLLQEKRLQEPAEPAWHSAVLPFAAGMSAAAAVFAFVKATVQKRAQSEPLLSAA